MNEELTTEQKLSIVSKSSELTEAVKLLALAFEDCRLEQHISFEYDFFENKYNLSFYKKDTINWISVKDKLPEIIKGKDYSENVLACCNGELMVVTRSFNYDDNGNYSWFWANCYGNIDGDGEIDDDYEITHWMPLPKPIKK